MVDGYQPLPDSQWQVIVSVLHTQRKRRHSLRQIVDALRYICRTGCQWRRLPTCFPPWSAVYYYFAQWRADGTFERLSQASNRADRLAQGRLPTPALALVDAQSVKLAPRLTQQRGLDAHKRVNGRKRQVRCDTDGRSWRVQVPAASRHLHPPTAPSPSCHPASTCARPGLAGCVPCSLTAPITAALPSRCAP